MHESWSCGVAESYIYQFFPAKYLFKSLVIARFLFVSLSDFPLIVVRAWPRFMYLTTGESTVHVCCFMFFIFSQFDLSEMRHLINSSDVCFTFLISLFVMNYVAVSISQCVGCLFDMR